MYPAAIAEAPIRISAPPLGSQTPRSDRSPSPESIVAARELLRAVPNPLGVSRWPLGVSAKLIDASPKRIEASARPVDLVPGLGDIVPD